MRQLTKILLINWHMFTCTEVNVRNHILITGHNGAGKSTLLDAIQYVLTGGKTKFNLAANEDGARKLEGYVRGRLGTESQEYLRTNDVTSHIALQFYDEEEKRYFIIGAVIDLPEGGKCREYFYTAYRTKADKKLFIRDSGEILTKSQFERNLKKLNIRNHFANTKEEARRMVNASFNLNRKYSELIPRALAFKPIGDLNEFMYRFLLPEEQVDIKALRENVQLYRKFENTLQEQRYRLQILQDINDRYLKMQSLEIQAQINMYLSGLIFIAENTEKREKLKNRMRENEQKLNGRRNTEARLTGQLNTIVRQIADIQNQIQALDTDGRIMRLENQQTELKHRFRDCKVWLEHTEAAVRKDDKALNALGIEHDWNGEKDSVISDLQLADKLYRAQKKVRELQENNTVRRTRIKDEKEAVQKELEQASQTLHMLEQKQVPYDRNVQGLIDLLKDELKKAVGNDVIVRPLCEYLEITDEKWRNAVEGYLNTQRFDILIEPQYFARAARIYEQFKGSRGIFGAGIVDVAKLDSYTEIKEGTLAEKVQTENVYARKYANMLLGRVACEETADLLNRHKRAITPSCMYYSNYAVRAINPRVYMHPFIGRRAIEMQLETARTKQSELRSKLQLVNRRERETENQREILQDIDFGYVSTFAASQQNYISTSDELASVKEQLGQLKKDPSWVTLQEQMDAMNVRQNECSEQLHAEQEEIARLKADNETKETEYYDLEKLLKQTRVSQDEMRETLLNQMKTIDEQYAALRRDARGEYSRMRFRNEENKKKIEQEKRTAEFEIKDRMHDFNIRTGFGLEETLASVNVFIAQYDKLKTVDIEDSINKTIAAREKCEHTFQEDFISTLRSKIERAKANLKQLNKALEDKSFQGDRYSFVYDASSDPIFARYYKILCSGQDYPKNTMFMEELSEQNRQLMEELFSRLVTVDNNEKNERILRDYTDYRKYMKYDIQITHENGDVTMFSKVNKEKSGGETQTPFYVIIAASFDQLAIAKKGSSGCLVLFDEAFNNMDENRIEALMRFYRSLNIQLMIAVPEGRVRNIMPYTETKLLLVKQNSHILTKEIINEADREIRA